MIFRHIQNVKVRAVFSNDKKFRYRLEIVKEGKSDQGKTVCAVMQNPSVANEDIADKSIQFLEKLIFEKGYAQFEGVNKLIIVNQFSYVQTNDFTGYSEHIGEENDSYIIESITDSDIVLLAWGSSNIYEDRKEFVRSVIKGFSEKVIYETKAHPSRGSYADFIREYII